MVCLHKRVQSQICVVYCTVFSVYLLLCRPSKLQQGLNYTTFNFLMCHSSSDLQGNVWKLGVILCESPCHISFKWITWLVNKYLLITKSSKISIHSGTLYNFHKTCFEVQYTGCPNQSEYSSCDWHFPVHPQRNQEETDQNSRWRSIRLFFQFEWFNGVYTYSNKDLTALTAVYKAN